MVVMWCGVCLDAELATDMALRDSCMHSNATSGAGSSSTNNSRRGSSYMDSGRDCKSVRGKALWQGLLKEMDAAWKWDRHGMRSFAICSVRGLGSGFAGLLIVVARRILLVE